MRKLSEISALNRDTLKDIGAAISNVKLQDCMVKISQMEDSVRAIAKKENRPLKNRVLNDLKDELVIPVFDPAGLSNIPVFIPFWIASYNGKIVCVVNLTQRGRQDKKTGEIVVHPKTLFSLLMCGTVIRQMTINEHNVMGSTKLLTSLSKIYSRIFAKILDKNFAISANDLYLDQIRYLAAKFFLISIVGKPNTPSISDIAAKSIGTSSIQGVRQVDAMMPTEAYANLTTFVKALGDVFKRLAKLSTRLLLGDTVRTYSAVSFLILEYCPYFVANILLAQTSAGINNEFSYDSVLDKDGLAVYSEMARIIQ